MECSKSLLLCLIKTQSEAFFDHWPISLRCVLDDHARKRAPSNQSSNKMSNDREHGHCYRFAWIRRSATPIFLLIDHCTDFLSLAKNEE